MSFGYRAGHPVLDHVSWSLPAGRRTVMLGPNGAGKSTLLKLMAGALVPQGGSLQRDGRVLGVKDLRRVVAWMPQEVVPVRGLRVWEQVSFAGWLAGMSERAARVATEGALVAVGLEELRDRRSDQLSGGQLRRVGLAEALVRPGAIVVLDEPTAGLDPAQRAAFRKILAGQQGALLVSTHQLDDIDRIFDHVVVLVEGAVRFSGSVADFFALVPDGASGSATAEEVFALFVPRGTH